MHDLKCRTEQSFSVVVRRCAICHHLLGNPYRFPDDYPIEWRWCCSCADIADILVERDMEWINRIFKGQSKIVEKCEKINKMITIDV